MESFIKPLLELESFTQLTQALSPGKSQLVTGAMDSQQVHIMYAAHCHAKKPMLVITHNENKAKDIYHDLQFFMKDRVLFYPAKDFVFYSADVHSADITKQRFMALDHLLHGQVDALVMTVEALFDRFMPKAQFMSNIHQLAIGDVVSAADFAAQLIYMGYERRDPVEAPGQFSIRGGIIDIYSPTESSAFRLELFGDEIDSIRMIDILSQRSVEKRDAVRVFPMRELIYTDEQLIQATTKIEKEYKDRLKTLLAKGLAEEANNLKHHVGELVERLKTEKTFHGVENYIRFFCQETVSLLDYFPTDSMIVYDDCNKIRSHAANILTEYKDSYENRIKKGYVLPSQWEMLFMYEDILHYAKDFSQVVFMAHHQSTEDFVFSGEYPFAVGPTASFGNKLSLFLEELAKLKKHNKRVIVLGGPSSRCERLSYELSKRGLEAPFIRNPAACFPQEGQILITRGSLRFGYEFKEIQFVVISDRELFKDEKKSRRGKNKAKGRKIESFEDIHIGDYVVHEVHGVGRYEGIENIVVEEVARDYLKISYANGGSLFVPTNQMDVIQKLASSDGQSLPRLSKLGGKEWNKTKTKVQKAVQDVAKDLVKLYAKRQQTIGFQFSEDSVWQQEFEDTFPYEETEDQLAAIEEVKQDMESGRVMDRLICGDVGYGKTEVAIRAAFKAVQDGKQVAFLIPTTILAQQHYNNFMDRMENFPVQVEMLSRFRTPAQQKKTLAMLKEGTADIVIGTHRILSKDVVFKNLGLVIVDEEQRFGVTHKEKLKNLKENVDVLTLTATPIPRTLHMSLTGIRDMSILEDPPQQRHPVQTYVMEYNQEFVKDAIYRELARGGQVYYLHNRVKTISQEAAKVQEIVPDARVGYAHGQMTERELENIMMDFVEGNLDVLVCTTIIETGLDISNVNTIIINDADRMGLSQLYQLRGRVGRSNKIAYAYLMYKRDKVLQEVAEKRLQIIKEFTEFGSGFKIAMRDLEIRGAGNLLGEQQSGHMELVGYDLYCKMLEEALASLQGEPVKENFETAVELQVNAYIPESYIPNESQKLEIYKKIASITNETEYMDIQEEIEDRYGDIPKSVNHLLDIALIKALAHELQMTSVGYKQKGVIFTFKQGADIAPDAIATLFTRHKGQLLFTNTNNHPDPALSQGYITYKVENDAKILLNIKNILQELKKLNSRECSSIMG